jgi:hypothetical protein
MFIITKHETRKKKLKNGRKNWRISHGAMEDVASQEENE